MSSGVRRPLILSNSRPNFPSTGAVHTCDGVPTMAPRIWKYEHFATEYWQFIDPTPFTPAVRTVTRCVGDEDSTCLHLTPQSPRALTPRTPFNSGSLRPLTRSTSFAARHVPCPSSFRRRMKAVRLREDFDGMCQESTLCFRAV
ncbi:hypothetical protein B0H11DRAFT_2052221 [Mycena galericulata]|nr:hypothetical protein B0H11DRAFT_2052221 [Mycena galericulata]